MSSQGIDQIKYSWKQVMSNDSKIVRKEGRLREKPNFPPELLYEETEIGFFSKDLEERCHRLAELPQHNNLMTIKSVRVHDKKQNVQLIYRCFEDPLTLDQLVREKRKIGGTNEYLMFFYRIVLGLYHLERHQLCHLNISPDSIYIFLPSEKELNFGKVAPMAVLGHPLINFETYMHNSNSRHPEICNETVKYFSEDPRTMMKYDLWSMGVIIYALMMGRYPFCKKAFFSDKWEFEMSLTKKPEAELSNLTKSLGKCLITELVRKCWLDSSSVRSWNDIIVLFNEKMFIPKTEMSSIHNITKRHLRLIFLLSQIYILIFTQIKFNFYEIWKDIICSRFGECILCLARLYHKKEFIRNFYTRSRILSKETRIFFDQVTNFLDREFEFRKRYGMFKELQVKEDGLTLEYIFKLMMKSQIKLKMKLEAMNKHDQNRSIKIFGEFLEELTECSNHMEKMQNSEREQYVVYLSRSEKMAQIAEDYFEFGYPEEFMK